MKQDNVQLAVSLLSPRFPLLGWFATVRWATAMHFLLALLALPFSVLWDQVGCLRRIRDRLPLYKIVIVKQE
jgi:hypothetical protein